MRIRFHTDYEGTGGRIPAPDWPEDWPPPRVGDSVINRQGRSLMVTSVDWLPHGVDDSAPFVYVVLHGDARP